jgi:hypothetical protein
MQAVGYCLFFLAARFHQDPADSASGLQPMDPSNICLWRKPGSRIIILTFRSRPRVWTRSMAACRWIVSFLSLATPSRIVRWLWTRTDGKVEHCCSSIHGIPSSRQARRLSHLRFNAWLRPFACLHAPRHMDHPCPREYLSSAHLDSGFCRPPFQTPPCHLMTPLRFRKDNPASGIDERVTSTVVFHSAQNGNGTSLLRGTMPWDITSYISTTIRHGHGVACLPLRITYYLSTYGHGRQETARSGTGVIFLTQYLPCLAVDAALGLGPFCLWMMARPACLSRLSFVSLLFPCCFCVLS